MLTHLDLFSGIGGFALACQWNGIETIVFVEIDKYCQKVLKKHWPNVPIVGDIRDVEKIKTIADSRCFGQEKCQEQTAGIKQCSEIKEIVANATSEGTCGLGEDKTLSGNGRNAIFTNRLQTPKATSSSRNNNGGRTGRATSESPAILVTAGFPCQPFSVAGKRGGEKDDRYLWPETLAVIEAIKPQWVLLENVTGIINLALDTVLSDLEGASYSCETLIIPACAVNAWHRRDRIWIVGYSVSDGYENGHTETRGTKSRSEQGGVCQSKGTGDVANSVSTEGRSKPRRLVSGTQNERGRTPEDGGTPICPRAEASLTSKSGQTGDIVSLSKSRESREQTEQEGGQGSGRGGQEDVADTQREGLALRISHTRGSEKGIPGPQQADWRAVESRLGGMVDGIPPFVDGYFDTEPDIRRVTKGGKNRVDRLKCLGNAIVPQAAYEIIKMITEIEKQS